MSIHAPRRAVAVRVAASDDAEHCGQLTGVDWATNWFELCTIVMTLALRTKKKRGHTHTHAGPFLHQLPNVSRSYLTTARPSPPAASNYLAAPTRSDLLTGSCSRSARAGTEQRA